jgi:hypothetical protein
LFFVIVSIIIKAIIASASLYNIIKPSYDSYCRSPAISSSDPPPAAALAARRRQALPRRRDRPLRAGLAA